MLIQAPCGSRCAASMLSRADAGAGLATLHAGVAPADATATASSRAPAPRLPGTRPPPRRVAAVPEHLLHPILDLAERRRQEPKHQPRLQEESTRLNSSHLGISYAVFCLKKKTHAGTRI